jgi:3-dehydroquinate dehydratase II
MSVVNIINGPNLNMVGFREAAHYGTMRYADMSQLLEREAKTRGLALRIRQSNIEGELITWIQDAAMAGEAVIINAGGYTHTSVALHDALKISKAPKIEVHMSNVHAREEFRGHSYLSPAVDGIIVGFGTESYILALDWVARRLKSEKQ